MSPTLFGFAPLHFSPLATFLIYLLVDMARIACATLLYFRALQVSPLSLCIPFIAFTPLFLIPSGYVLLGELPSVVKLLGVVLVVTGSLLMHRQLFAVGWLEPLKAVVRERGSRYMLMVAFIFSLTNPLDVKLVRMSDAYTLAFSYGVMLCLVFAGLAFARRAEWRPVMRAAPFWVVMAGALMIYLPMTLVQSLIVTSAVSAGTGVALYLTRRRETAEIHVSIIDLTESSSAAPSGVGPT